MRSRKALTLFLALAMILGMALMAEARGPAVGRGFMGLKTILSLDLSDEQEAEIRQILDRYEGEMEAVRERSFHLRRDLRRALREEPVNEGDLRKTFRAQSTVREDHLVLGVRMRAELKQVLSPDQLEILEKQRGQRLERFKDRFCKPAESREE